jgi:hypothetical protein
MKEAMRTLIGEGAALTAVQAMLKDAAHRHDDEALHGLAAIIVGTSERLYATAERLQLEAG